MGCGIAPFGRRCQKKHIKLKMLVFKFVPWTSRQPVMRPRDNRSDHCGLPRGPIAGFMCFFALPTKTSFTTPNYYPKYEVWVIEFFCGRIPFKRGGIFGQKTPILSFFCHVRGKEFLGFSVCATYFCLRISPALA